MINLLRDSHDGAPKMASKTGHARAQHMYIPVDLPIYPACMQSLHEHMLAHRLIASDLKFDALSVEDRIHHAVKTYELEGKVVSRFAFLDQFGFYGRGIEHFKENLIEGTVLELQYLW